LVNMDSKDPEEKKEGEKNADGTPISKDGS
jgi:hypothetical protein